MAKPITTSSMSPTAVLPNPAKVGSHDSSVRDFIPVTQIPGWTAAATETLMSHGVALHVNSGMLCIKLTDMPRAMAVLQRLFGGR